MTPGQSACVSTCPYVKEISVNDDIEKRVLVNKDGSLSVEMRVRFRLFNDETLLWSTEIKKSSTKVTDSASSNETAQRYLQAKAECSDPDSISPSETEEAFATKLHKKHLEESLRQNCCNHCQEYDIWKNPMHKDTCKSSSSSGSSQKVMCKKTSMDSTHTISCSSEEYTEHVVEKASCFQQTIEEGDTRVEFCARSHCCSRSEVSASKSRTMCKDDCERNAKNKCCHTELSPAPHYEVTEERAISAISNSSKVLERLKDDQDDEYDDLPLSVSRASNWSQSDHLEGDAQSKCIHCCDCRMSPRSRLSPRPPSKVSSGAVRSLRSKKYKTTLVETDGLVNHTARATSTISGVSSRSPAGTPASGRQRRSKKGARSIISRASCKSEGQIKTPTASDALEICEDGNVQENGCVSAMLVKSSICLWCDGLNPKETESQNAEKDSTTSKDAQENCKTINDYKSERSETAQSKHSDASATSNISKLSNREKCPEVETAEERAKSSMPTKSAESTKSKPNCIISDREPTPTSLSEAKSDHKSNPCSEHRPLASEETKTFVKMCCKLLQTKATEDSSSADVQCDHEEESCETPVKSNASSKHSHVQKKDSNGNVSTSECNERVPSATSDTSSASCRSHKSSHNLPETIVTSVPDCETVSKRATSAMSQTSAMSERSIKITTPDATAFQEMKAEEGDKDRRQNALTVTSPSTRRSPSPNRRKSTKTDVKKSNSRATSGMSVNSKVSSRSQRSSKCHCHSSSGHLGESKTQKEGVKDESERVLSRSSGKSLLSAQSQLNMKSLCGQLDEPLSPTSTVSVSLGLPEEDKCDDFEVASKPNSVVMSDISQKCTSLPQGKQNKHKASILNPDSCDSVLSQALSAADLLREIAANARPVSRESKSITSSRNIDKVEKTKDCKSEKSSKSKHGKVSKSSVHNNEEQYSIMPSCLPNATPTEVVNDWLMNNPFDGPAYEIDVELTENTEIQGEEEASGDKSEAFGNVTEVIDPHEEETENHIEMENNITCVTQSCDKKPHQVESSELDKQCPSSVQVMKVLLGPKLNRCRSLPEVSPVYGRKLSRSAQGLLDCLANLQLIESDSKSENHPKYNEVMTILQSLWLQEPYEDEPNKQTKREHQSREDEFNLQSSSGVDVSSGSTGSGKGSMSGVVKKSETAHGKISPIPELEALNKDKEEIVMEDEKTTAPCEETSNISDPTTPDTAERVQGSPENKDVNDSQENTNVPPAENDVENKDESDQTQQTSSNKSSGNDMTENTSSGTPPSVKRAPLAKRISQDPDPIWVLSLLKKLEKQFMLHYVDAMAEFKVKWDLDDNEMLNAMIGELKEEVHKRIQSSITRELQKIQSRAGRGPRPPGNALSRESTAQTEQRRRRLRVMRNKSQVSRSEENFTASGTENSDQRSDDEYCPCDSCMKRKMASRGAQRAEVLSLAPVMMEFDLRKILQMKKDPVKPAERKVKDQNTAHGSGTGEDNNLEVLHEEVEEGNVNIRGCSNEGANDKDNSQDVCKDPETKDEECDENDGKEVEENKAEGIQEDAEKEATEEDDEKKEDTEENTETREETTETEEETEPREEEKAQEDEAEETKNGEDQPITAGNSKSNEEDFDVDEPNEKNDDVNQTESQKDEAEKDEVEDEDQLTSSRVNIQSEVTQDPNNSTEEACTEDTEKPKSAESSGVDSEMTRTSMESQPGSVENSTNQQAKLCDLQSFMESVESQGESVVVITKQPPYKESDELHGQDNQKNISNGVMEWQISPKIKTKTNRQKKQKDSDILMNGK